MDTDSENGDPEEDPFEPKKKLEDVEDDEDMEDGGYPESDPDNSGGFDSGHSFPSVRN